MRVSEEKKLRLQASFTKILLCKQISRRLIIHTIRISALKWLFCLIWWNVGCFYSKIYIHMRYTCLIKDLTKNGRYKYVCRRWRRAVKVHGTLCNFVLLHGKNKIFLGCYLCSFIFMFVFHFVCFFIRCHCRETYFINSAKTWCFLSLLLETYSLTCANILKLA